MKGGKRMAVLAGCNYAGRGSSELKGCINDVVSMKEVLIWSFGFKEDNIELLTDDATTLMKKPTGANIKNALLRMIRQAGPGDLLFFHFSGHGTLLRDRNHGGIVPCDYNVITDMDFRQLVNMIHHKATFTILADSCHSGGLIYQEKEQIGPSTIPAKPVTTSCMSKCIPIEDIENMFQQNTGLNLNIGDFMTLYFRDEASLSFQPSFRLGFHHYRNGKAYDNGVLLSACQNNELAVDGTGIKPPHGMFSHAVMNVLKNAGKVVSNRLLVTVTRKFLEDSQHPCLYSSDENADATFLLQHQAYTN